MIASGLVKNYDPREVLIAVTLTPLSSSSLSLLFFRLLACVYNNADFCFLHIYM